MQACLMINFVQSQENAKIKLNQNNEQVEFFAYFILGMNKLGISAINDNLEQKEYSTYSPNFISMGGGSHIGTPYFLIGGEGYGFFSKQKSQNIGGLYRTSLDAGYGFFNIGRVLYLKKKFKICSFLGLGGGTIKLKINENESPSSFCEVLNNPKLYSELTLGGFLVDLSLRFEILFPLSKPTKSSDEDNSLDSGYYPIGIRVGYVLAPFDDNWEVDNIELPVGPIIGMLGPYIRISFGLGIVNYSQN